MEKDQRQRTMPEMIPTLPVDEMGEKRRCRRPGRTRSQTRRSLFLAGVCWSLLLSSSSSRLASSSSSGLGLRRKETESSIGRRHLGGVVVGVARRNDSTQFPSTTTTRRTTTTATANNTTTTRPNVVYHWANLPPCNYTSGQLAALGPLDPPLEPCILADNYNDTLHYDNNNNTDNSATGTSSGVVVLTLVQVTPANCPNNRDGAWTAANLLQQQGGFPIGFQASSSSSSSSSSAAFSNSSHQTAWTNQTRVVFRYVSVVAGNSAALNATEYAQRHVGLLHMLLTEIDQVAYVVGTCSFVAALEKPVVQAHAKILLTQVGPPSFYYPNNSNPYVFGMHINSDLYPFSAVQQLGFYVAHSSPDSSSSTSSSNALPVRVLYRTASEFFASTCGAAYQAALQTPGLTVQAYSYDPQADDDGNGITNQFDAGFLQNLTDQFLCPPVTFSARAEHPALFLCVNTEQDILLARLRENGCRPTSLWMTPATWTWADQHVDQVSYMLGGGQWHPAMDYSDEFWASGQDLLQYNQELFGYPGSYDMVVSYSMVMLMARHLQAVYRIVDAPDPRSDLAQPDVYEQWRRQMVILQTNTLFGPVSFDENQRNNGRAPAGTQWLPVQSTTSPVSSNSSTGNQTTSDTAPATNFTNNSNQTTNLFRNMLVSPELQAESATVLPAPSATTCLAGEFVNLTLVAESAALLSHPCQACPVDTYSTMPNGDTSCQACPAGTSTEQLEGQTACIRYEDNLLGPGLLSLGYIGVGITWILAGVFVAWMYKNRKDLVVKIGQAEFLILICLGAIVSSSSVIGFSMQAGTGEDTTAASRGCQAASFLYTIGWMMEYTSLSVKTYRLYRVTQNITGQRVQIQSYRLLAFVVVAILLDVILVTVWHFVAPLQYVRTVTSRDVSDGMITITSKGVCAVEEGNGQPWYFIGPLLAIHALLMIGTNVLLYKVRNVNDRYQEQKYVGLASIFVFEIAVIGLPVLIAVRDSAAARYIVMASVVVLNDIGILCFIFIPKINFQKQGLPQGVGLGESLKKETMRRASARIQSQRDFSGYSMRSQNHFDQSESPISEEYVGAPGSSDSGDSDAKRTESSSFIGVSFQYPSCDESPQESNPSGFTTYSNDDAGRMGKSSWADMSLPSHSIVESRAQLESIMEVHSGEFEGDSERDKDDPEGATNVSTIESRSPELTERRTDDAEVSFEDLETSIPMPDSPPFDIETNAASSTSFVF